MVYTKDGSVREIAKASLWADKWHYRLDPELREDTGTLRCRHMVVTADRLRRALPLVASQLAA